MKNQLINKKIDILDKGHIMLLDYMGTDEEICESARISYGVDKKERTKEQNEQLLRYLYRHEHMSPFEMAQIKIAFKMPIFVARQLIRHRTASVNEISGRYSIMKDEYYTPEQWRKQSKDNKQGSEATDEIDIVHVDMLYQNSCSQAFEAYTSILENGIGKEMARMNLPLSTYTEWYWTCDLRNILHMLKLRLDSHAQYEIRVYAEAIAEIVKELFPMTWKAFNDYQLDSIKLSKQEVLCLRDIIFSKNDYDIIPNYIPNELEANEFKSKIQKILESK